MKGLLTCLTVCLVLMSALLQGCGVDGHMEKMDQNTARMASELENDQQYIKSLTEQLKSLAQSLSLLQSMSAPMFGAIMKTMLAQTPPAKSDEIDDALKNAPMPAPLPIAPALDAPTKDALK